MVQAIAAVGRHPFRYGAGWILFSVVMVLFVSMAAFVMLVALTNLAAGTVRLTERGSTRWVVRPRPLMIGSGLVMLGLAAYTFATMPRGIVVYVVTR